MPKRRSAHEDRDTSRPRQLRKRLRKAEDQLADAVQKRDRAQARVEALSIIADEIRAQMAEADKVAEQEASAAARVEADAGKTDGATPGPAASATPRARRSTRKVGADTPATGADTADGPVVL